MDVYYGSCAWGDYDNDGDLDVSFCGYTSVSIYTRIYRNTGSGFSQAFSLDPLHDGSHTWADVDRDGDLDFLHMGTYYGWHERTQLYRNDGGVPNTAPTEPTDLTTEWTPDGLRLSWSGASDAETPTAGLYYCLRVRTLPGAHDVMSGTYGTPLMGNVGQATEWVLRVPPGTYYWSVRAIDSGLMASPWSREGSTDMTPILLVASKETDSVLAFQGDTGEFIRTLAGPDSGLDYPNAFLLDRDNHFYVSSVGSDSVIKYSLLTGEPLMQLSGGGLDGPVGLAFTDIGTLLVSSYVTGSVKEFNLETGLWIRDFVGPGSGGLDGPDALRWARNGNLLVSSQRTDQVLEYDGETGEFFGVAAAGGGLDGPGGLLHNRAGNLLVASFYSDSVLEYATDGTFLGAFVTSGSGGLDGALGLAWGPSGNLLVCSRWNSKVLEYDCDDGHCVGTFASGAGMDEPTQLCMATVDDPDCNENGVIDHWDIDLGTSTDFNHNGVPDDCECLGDLNDDGVVDLTDLAVMLAYYGQSGPHIDPEDGDIDDDDDVDLSDLAILLGFYGTECD